MIGWNNQLVKGTKQSKKRYLQIQLIDRFINGPIHLERTDYSVHHCTKLTNCNGSINNYFLYKCTFLRSIWIIGITWQGNLSSTGLVWEVPNAVVSWYIIHLSRKCRIHRSCRLMLFWQPFKVIVHQHIDIGRWIEEQVEYNYVAGY